jgi:hypothetical protein
MDVQHKPHQLSEAWQSADVVFVRAHTRVFRVSGSVLRAHSLILHDMFTVPYRPSANMEIIDGFPVVVLHNDPQEVEAFLTAIFDSRYVYSPSDYIFSDLSIRFALEILHATACQPPARRRDWDPSSIQQIWRSLSPPPCS